jgi:hypothetical protein
MLTISRRRLLLECSRCRQAKLIDVDVTDDGMLGVTRCDVCKTDDLRYANASRRRQRRPLRRTEPAPHPEPTDPEEMRPGEILRRVRIALGDHSPVR